MVKSAEYWNGHHLVVVRNVVPLGLEFERFESNSGIPGGLRDQRKFNGSRVDDIFGEPESVVRIISDWKRF